MSDDPAGDNHEFEGLGIVCGEDLDAVLAGEEATVRAWSIGVLSTALQRVLVWGAEAEQLLDLAIRILCEYSGGDEECAEDSAPWIWLNANHRRGREWSQFAGLVPDFIERMNAKWASKAAKPRMEPMPDDDVPF